MQPYDIIQITSPKHHRTGLHGIITVENIYNKYGIELFTGEEIKLIQVDWIAPVDDIPTDVLVKYINNWAVTNRDIRDAKLSELTRLFTNHFQIDVGGVKEFKMVSTLVVKNYTGKIL